ncbi:MAG: FtsX-like permease family protein, partial [Microcystaceae cyanobacterium]
MMTILWLKGLLSRRPGRLLGAIVGVALTVALLALIGAFTVASAASMTQRAIAAVPVDWQIQLALNANPQTVIAAVGQSTPYTALQKVGYAESAGFTANTNGTVQTTGPGKVLGISLQYRQDFPAQLRPLIGVLDGVLVAQQTAANLHVTVGDTVTIQRVGLPPVPVKVNGVIDLPYADSLFQTVGVPAGVAPQAPPDNVLVLPSHQWHQIFDPQATVRPDSVRSQLHVRLAHHLPNDPGTAYTYVQQLAQNLEARISGSGIVGNNLAARLDGVRADALYARVLFLFLGLPGVILAILLTLAITAAGKERRRQEQALLRLRGADTGQILRLESVEALIVGLGGMILGIGLSYVAASTIFPIGMLTSTTTLFWTGGAALVGLILALCAMLYPAWKEARSSTVIAARAVIGVRRKPVWQQVYLDLFFLTASAAIFWQTASTGYQVVLAPEGVPQASVSYESFIAPVCLWLGAGLLTIRFWEMLLNRGRHLLARGLYPALGSLSGVVVASLSRQRVLVTRGVVLVALSFSFAVSTAVFNTTYNAQSRVDAELTNGSDVQVAVPPGKGGIPSPLQDRLRTLPGVVGLQPMQHRFAYVGTDLQDLYGIDPLRLSEATHLSNAYFAAGNAQATLKLLASRPDGLLVSEETVTDYQLKPGDLINLRLQNAQDRQYHVIPFHFVDIVKEFPTAPKDSFLVANTGYIAQQTDNNATEIVLMRTNGKATDLAEKVRGAVNFLAGVKVTDIGSTQQAIGSSLTAVDLRGLTRLELSFAVLLMAGATGLVMALGMAERRRTFAILTALGAKNNQLGAFLWSEGLLILIGGSAFGIVMGFGVAQMLVKVLTGVFDPPPDLLYVPWTYLVLLAVAASVSTGVAVFVTQVASH